MKKFLVAVFAFVIAGCVAHVTPEGTYIDPLPATVVVGPPVVVEPPPAVVVRPLPPVMVVPNRYLYFHDGFYYYYWGNAWYWGRESRGPWYVLPRNHWPPRMKRR